MDTASSRGSGPVPPPERGAYAADTSPERMIPPSDPWIVRVQLPLARGLVRVVAPHGAEWNAPAYALRAATPAERAWYDAHVPRPRTAETRHAS